jgi:hypothetical protein
MFFFFRDFLFAKSGLSLFFFPCLPPLSVAIVFVFFFPFLERDAPPLHPEDVRFDPTSPTSFDLVLSTRLDEISLPPAADMA